MDTSNTTIIICCAGTGTRLGIGTTKCLIDICGKPLIIRQLELLKNYTDIRIVVGYQAEKVIEIVTKFRKDIIFVFNYDYATTGVGVSLKKALLTAKRYTVEIDGDMLINPHDLTQLINYPGECIGGNRPTSAEPVYLEVSDGRVTGFSKQPREWEWSGLAKIETNKFNMVKEYVYEMIQPLLPIPLVCVRVRDIDTVGDYKSAVEWFTQGCLE